MANEKVGGIEMEAELDTGPLEQGLKKVEKAVESLDPALRKTDKGMKDVEKASKGAAEGLDKTTLASRTLAYTLGQLGAGSIQQVLSKLTQVARESITLAINLEGVEVRARALFGEAFPRVTAELERMAQRMNRSKSDLLEYATGFGNLLDSIGVSGDKIETYSTQLAGLTVTLGKAHPDMSDADVYRAIEGAVRGNQKALADLSLSMKQDSLQAVANRVAHGLLVKDMTDEQLARIRLIYLMEETTKQQQAGEDATGKLGDTAKTAGAAWNDFKETLGTFLSGPVAEGLAVITTALQFLIAQVEGVMKVMNAASSIGKWFDSIFKGPQKNVLDLNAPGFGPAGAKPTTTGTKSGDDWRNHNVDAAGGAKKAADEIKKIEEDILKTWGEQAKANKERVQSQRDELKLREKMGILTKEEERMLARINDRAEFQADKIDDATQAWEDQVEVLKKVEDKIKDINSRIAEEQASLKETLADIEKDAGRNREDKIADIIKEKREIENDIAQGRGANQDKQDRLRALDEMLQQARTESPDQFAEGRRISELSDLDRLDVDKQRKIDDAKAESEARIAGLRAELAEAENNKIQIISLEQAKKQAVIDALNERSIQTAEIYAKIELDTENHIAKQIEQFGRLTSAQRSPSIPAVRRAAGGPIFGPGGPTDDLVPALLSNGEFVVNARAYSANRQIVEAINAGMRLQIPRFAEGGAVTQNNQKSATINITNHGRAAEVFANPRHARWHARTFLG